MHAVGSTQWGLSKPYRGPHVKAVLLEHERRGSPWGRELRRDTHHHYQAAGVLKVEHWTSLELLTTFGEMCRIRCMWPTSDCWFETRVCEWSNQNVQVSGQDFVSNYHSLEDYHQVCRLYFIWPCYCVFMKPKAQKYSSLGIRCVLGFVLFSPFGPSDFKDSNS